MMTVPFAEYLNVAAKLGIVPNFWLTEEYLTFSHKVSKIWAVKKHDFIWIEDGDWVLFPPLPLSDRRDIPFSSPIWADFPNCSVGEELEFVDWEYWYDSRDFLDMKGGNWQVFRKNCRKWPKANPSWEYTHISPRNGQIAELMIQWLESRPDAEIHDPDVMTLFLQQGRNRAFLYTGDKLVGINVWDNFLDYTVFRYCITRPEERFLNEFARLLFYREMAQRGNYLVIDGGSLGLPGLERFKDKLNPRRKRAVYSRLGREGEQWQLTNGGRPNENLA